MTRIAVFQSNTGIDPQANAHVLEQAGANQNRRRHCDLSYYQRTTQTIR